ncbi:NAD-dependent epimerase/dehydratase family protein [Carboxylicivirga linearis]|uniref:NAD-dependent epimerase/dehydratase family protein n=1 Tax=Carboxylicivirga linearis TaxID=1628157 RepID=A0ABS5JW23_9BACT|nr:NAD-dependent epimerase/dehydratase family protein [Carboxylicivirga linearis]MBS2098546.1 NAD-dependent epimerase/dehydratase family protein [Carboxylicivirga linearis]
MNILVIGSKGFIGAHTLAYFRKKYDDVYGCDVVVDYTDDKYYQIDASQPDFQAPFQKKNYEFCINCSGAASVPLSIKYPLRDYQLNTANVFKLLSAIKELNPACKFINLSSAAVYGNPKTIPIGENALIKPVSPYGEHKKMAEDICSEFYYFFSLPTCNLRIFSAYGPGLKKQLLWDLFQKCTTDSFELFGTGNETRDFIYIDDVIQAIEVIMNSDAVFKAGVVNVANGYQVSIKELVHVFTHKLNYRGKYVFSGSNRAGDPINWEADINLIQTLGYRQTVSLEDGIIKYIEWAKRLG